MIWIISEITIGLILLLFLFVPKNKTNETFEISSSTYGISLFFLIFIFIFLITYKVNEIPIPYHVDEASIVYDASCLIKYHLDRHLYSFPVLFKSFGGAGQNALYIYLTAVFFKLFGISVLTLRLPAILLSLVSAAFFVLLVKKNYGNFASLISMFFFCILPFSIMHSRWGLESYLLFPMLIVSITVFFHAVRTKKNIYFFLSGISFGITLYSYGIAYMIVPILLGITVIYLFWINQMNWKNIIIMSIPLFILALPLILMLMVNYGCIDEIRTRFLSIPKLNGFRSSEISIANIINNLRFTKYNYFFRFFADDELYYNVIPEFGTMYYVSIPFVLYGFIQNIRTCINDVKSKIFSIDIVMFFLFLSVFSVTLLIKMPNINRLNGLYIPVLFFLMKCICELFKHRRTVIIIVLGIYMVLFSCFIKHYFTDFQKEIDKSELIASISDLTEALNFAESVNKNEEMIYILDPREASIFTLIIKNIDPFTFNEKKILAYDDYVKIIGNYRFRLDAVMPECIYIFKDVTKIPEDYYSDIFLLNQFGSFKVYYPRTD